MISKNCLKFSVMAMLCASVMAPAVANAGGATKLTLINGWKAYGFGTAKPTITAIKGVAYFGGAIKTTGTNTEPFILPAAFRPAARVYTKVDLCDAHNGRLNIGTDGTVTVEVGDGDFSEAQCFTSLDGVSFALSSDGYKPIKLLNGWSDTVFGTAAPAARVSGGTVYLEGAMSSSGTNTGAFALPAKDWPSATVYVPADMFGATNGRLIVGSNGQASVQSETDNSLAFGFTSLDGISFATSDAGFSALTLINGWEPYGTRDPKARVSGKLVQFEGSIATSGTNPAPFVMPANMRPKKTVYIPVDLCNAVNGRLQIDPGGSVTVEVENNDFSSAQCFTSLEGVSFLQ